MNPTVTLALATTRNFPWAYVSVYVIAQVIGATGTGLATCLTFGSDQPRVAERTVNEEDEMAYAIVHQFEGGTKEQYEASIAAVHPSDGSLPDGQQFHVAGPSAGGWTIMAIHDSQESWERFRDKTLMPRMAQGIEGGFAAPPQETTFEVHNQATS